MPFPVAARHTRMGVDPQQRIALTAGLAVVLVELDFTSFEVGNGPQRATENQVADTGRFAVSETDTLFSRRQDDLWVNDAVAPAAEMDVADKAGIELEI